MRLFVACFAFVGVEYLGFEETKEETWAFDSRIRCCQKERNRSGRKERNLSLSLFSQLALPEGSSSCRSILSGRLRFGKRRA